MSSDNESLPSLVPHDVDRNVAERIRRRAQAALSHERERAAHPSLARIGRVYDRAIEPALVVGACVVYLAWAAERTLALLH